MTLEQFIQHATRQLAAASPSPRLDAEVLVMHVTGHTRTALITRAHELLPPEHEERLHELLARRTRGKPVAYLTGKREFWSLDLRVTPDVLIPRPGIAKVDFRHGEWLKPLAGTRLDVIVSNPPYVRANDLHLTQGDVRFEPESALVAGADGLDAFRAIAAGAASCLRPGDWLLIEHGYDQAQAVRAPLVSHGYDRATSCRDTAGHERVTPGRLSSS